MIRQIGNVTLVGTSHVARESIEEIASAIEKESPQVVAVELDRRRAFALLTKSKKASKLQILRSMGFTALIMFSIGEFVQKNIGKMMDIEPGSDMLAALNIARQKNIKFALIDQDIETTMRRLSKSITWKDRRNILADIFGGIFGKKEKVEIDLAKVPPEDMIENVLGMLKERYPGIYRVLIHERNMVMAHRLMRISSEYPNDCIVAVIGAGHMQGVSEILMKSQHSSATPSLQGQP